MKELRQIVVLAPEDYPDHLTGAAQARTYRELKE
jgi:hypothetical protein